MSNNPCVTIGAHTLIDVSRDDTRSPVLCVERITDTQGKLTSAVNHQNKTLEMRLRELQERQVQAV